MVIEKRNKVG